MVPKSLQKLGGDSPLVPTLHVIQLSQMITCNSNSVRLFYLVNLFDDEVIFNLCLTYHNNILVLFENFIENTS